MLSAAAEATIGCAKWRPSHTGARATIAPEPYNLFAPSALLHLYSIFMIGCDLGIMIHWCKLNLHSVAVIMDRDEPI